MAPNNAANLMSPIPAFAGTAVATGLWLAALVAIPDLQRSGLHALSLRQLLRRTRPVAAVAA
jgi:hypothetical protein